MDSRDTFQVYPPGPDTICPAQQTGGKQGDGESVPGLLPEIFGPVLLYARHRITAI